MTSFAEQVADRYNTLAGQGLNADPRAVEERAERFYMSLAQATATAEPKNAPEHGLK